MPRAKDSAEALALAELSDAAIILDASPGVVLLTNSARELTEDALLPGTRLAKLLCGGSLEWSSMRKGLSCTWC